MSALVKRLESTGRSAQPILNRTGISLSQLTDPYGAVPLSRFVEFLEDAAEVVGDPNIGARIGTDLKAGDMGPVGILLSLSASVEAGISRFVRYTNALQGGTESQWILNGQFRVFTYRLTDPAIWPRRQDAAFSLSSLVQVVRDNFQSRWTPLEIHFEHSAPNDADQVERLFRCPVKYSQSINRIVVAKDMCDTLVRTEDPALLAALERHVREIIGTVVVAKTTRDSVAAVIESTLGLSPVTIDHVARALAMTPRSLQRRLAEEGVSIRQLLEGLRRDRAQLLLSQPHAKVSDVAEALGYSDPTAFWRAWRGWTGTAPSSLKPRRP
jgi:AraC-like DNA-binding protein